MQGGSQLLNHAHIIRVAAGFKADRGTVADFFFFYEVVHLRLAYRVENDILRCQLIPNHVQRFEKHLCAAPTGWENADVKAADVLEIKIVPNQKLVFKHPHFVVLVLRDVVSSRVFERSAGRTSHR